MQIWITLISGLFEVIGHRSLIYVKVLPGFFTARMILGTGEGFIKKNPSYIGSQRVQIKNISTCAQILLKMPKTTGNKSRKSLPVPNRC